MVGTIEPRKNHLLVLQAFFELWAEGFGGTLTIVGEAWLERRYILFWPLKRTEEFGRKLSWLKNVNDDKLIESYNQQVMS